MTNQQRLHEELKRVGQRHRRALWTAALAALWLVLALAGIALLTWARGGAGLAIVLAVFAAVVVLVGAFGIINLRRKVSDPLWLAHRIERRHPELDTGLLAALEPPVDPQRPTGYLEEAVVIEALDHARRTRWEQLISDRLLGGVRLTHNALLVAMGFIVIAVAVDSWHPRGSIARISRSVPAFEIKVEPEDTNIERGTGLLVLARFGQRLPTDVQLLYRDGQGQNQQMAMSRSLDDPLYAGRVASVNRDMTYAVRYGDAQTRWYKVSVFDYPELRQADARLNYPKYTGLPEKLIQDTRSVTAVQGTKATLTFHLNKPVARANLVPATRPSDESKSAPLKLAVDSKDPSAYTVALDLKQSQTYRLQLADEQGRANKDAVELVLNVTENRPPELKVAFPGKDVDVSPLEELALKANVSDDFGIERVGVSYVIAGAEPKDLVLGDKLKANQPREVAHLVAMEKLKAEPDQLLSYHFWAEDFGPDGKLRRTAGDMFFAEVRPFEEIFRQGQQPTADQQQQQQQGGQNAQQAEELAELQKQIIAATWKLIRREPVGAPPTPVFVPDVKMVAESQGSAKEKASGMTERVRDARSRTHLASALKNMTEAVARLTKALEPPSAVPLASALSSEQAAYQDLLKLRAREHQVVRGNRQQQQQGANSSSASARRQRQLDQLDLSNDENRYASERSAPQQQQAADDQRETRQVLSRLRELAQRQEDLNKQMRELQSQLQQARDQQQREELKRQLARLRDQQQQMLRDTDELRDRMDQPENQQRMADARQQLEQTRNNVRQASESLQQNMVPQAASAGARAAEQLNNLREQVRQSAAGQFTEAMDRMRQDARQLDQNQQDLSQRLANLDGAKPRENQQSRGPATQPGEGAQAQSDQKSDQSQREQRRGLRDSGERKQVAQNLAQQKQELEKLLQNLRQTVEDSENAEPLLSRQLYDAARELNQSRTDQALDASARLLERGFVEEAQKAEQQAGQGIAQLRQGVDKAAESVLGDEAEALRRARNELDALAQELDREMARNGRGGIGLSTQPTTQRSQFAMGGPTTRATGASTRPGGAARGSRDSQAATAPSNAAGQQQSQSSERSASAQNQRSDRQPQGGQQQAGEQQQQQSGQQQTGGQQQAGGQQQQGGQQEAGGQPNQQPGQGQAQASGGGLRRRPVSLGGESTSPANTAEELRRFLEQAGSTTDGTDGAEARGGPFTGENFRQWSDRLRDVEEMVGDPRIRADAARVRDRARAVRNEMERHSKEPNWDLVRDFVGRPLVELRDRVAEELLRKSKAEALVPIDREPVPSEYSEQVRQYYERLGSGR